MDKKKNETCMHMSVKYIYMKVTIYECRYVRIKTI